MLILMSTWTLLRDLKKKNCLLENIFFTSTKKGKIGDDGKISKGHISFKNYLTCEKVWDKFDIRDMGDYHNHYSKKDVLMFLKNLLIRP